MLIMVEAMYTWDLGVYEKSLNLPLNVAMNLKPLLKKTQNLLIKKKRQFSSQNNIGYMSLDI